ncbi:MAG TPA: SRPBCC family protein [Acidimicrobiales bacterium]|nr:SRPBCC family protein [Acidimicrobiales bacterium]
MITHVEVSREIKAPPAEVWAAISDVTRMGEWSPECHTCTWDEGFDGPAVGATFTGHNRNGDFEWTTQALVTESVPGQAFAFDGVFGELHFSKWAYRIEATADGCKVTETWDEGRPENVIELTKSISGVDDRASHNQKGMEETLARLAAAVER